MHNNFLLAIIFTQLSYWAFSEDIVKTRQTHITQLNSKTLFRPTLTENKKLTNLSTSLTYINKHRKANDKRKFNNLTINGKQKYTERLNGILSTRKYFRLAKDEIHNQKKSETKIQNNTSFISSKSVKNLLGNEKTSNKMEENLEKQESWVKRERILNEHAHSDFVNEAKEIAPNIVDKEIEKASAQDGSSGSGLLTLPIKPKKIEKIHSLPTTYIVLKIPDNIKSIQKPLPLVIKPAIRIEHPKIITPLGYSSKDHHYVQNKVLQLQNVVNKLSNKIDNNQESKDNEDHEFSDDDDVHDNGNELEWNNRQRNKYNKNDFKENVDDMFELIDDKMTKLVPQMDDGGINTKTNSAASNYGPGSDVSSKIKSESRLKATQEKHIENKLDRLKGMINDLNAKLNAVKQSDDDDDKNVEGYRDQNNIKGAKSSLMLTEQLTSLEKLIKTLSDKVENVENKVDMKPTELEKQNLMTDMSTTLSDLHSNVDNLASKIENNLNKNNEDKNEKDTEATALLATKIGKLENTLSVLGEKIKSLSVASSESVNKAMNSGLVVEQMKSNGRLEGAMNELTNKLSDLVEKLSKDATKLPTTPLPTIHLTTTEKPTTTAEPLKQREEEKQMLEKQALLSDQLDNIQQGMIVLANAIADSKEKQALKANNKQNIKSTKTTQKLVKQGNSLNTMSLELAKEALKTAAQTFSKIAEESQDRTSKLQDYSSFLPTYSNNLNNLSPPIPIQGEALTNPIANPSYFIQNHHQQQQLLPIQFSNSLANQQLSSTDLVAGIKFLTKLSNNKNVLASYLSDNKNNNKLLPTSKNLLFPLKRDDIGKETTADEKKKFDRQSSTYFTTEHEIQRRSATSLDAVFKMNKKDIPHNKKYLKQRIQTIPGTARNYVIRPFGTSRMFRNKYAINESVEPLNHNSITSLLRSMELKEKLEAMAGNVNITNPYIDNVEENVNKDNIQGTRTIPSFVTENQNYDDKYLVRNFLPPNMAQNNSDPDFEHFMTERLTSEARFLPHIHAAGQSLKQDVQATPITSTTAQVEKFPGRIVSPSSNPLLKPQLESVLFNTTGIQNKIISPSEVQQSEEKKFSGKNDAVNDTSNLNKKITPDIVGKLSAMANEAREASEAFVKTAKQINDAVTGKNTDSAYLSNITPSSPSTGATSARNEPMENVNGFKNSADHTNDDVRQPLTNKENDDTDWSKYLGDLPEDRVSSLIKYHDHGHHKDGDNDEDNDEDNDDSNHTTRHDDDYDNDNDGDKESSRIFNQYRKHDHLFDNDDDERFHHKGDDDDDNMDDDNMDKMHHQSKHEKNDYHRKKYNQEVKAESRAKQKDFRKENYHHAFLPLEKEFVEEPHIRTHKPRHHEITNDNIEFDNDKFHDTPIAPLDHYRDPARLSRIALKNLKKLRHKYKNLNNVDGSHYEYHGTHRDFDDGGTRQHTHHDMREEDEFNTDHSRHIGWIDHEDDDVDLYDPNNDRDNRHRESESHHGNDNFIDPERHRKQDEPMAPDIDDKGSIDPGYHGNEHESEVPCKRDGGCMGEGYHKEEMQVKSNKPVTSKELDYIQKYVNSDAPDKGIEKILQDDDIKSPHDDVPPPPNEMASHSKPIEEEVDDKPSVPPMDPIENRSPDMIDNKNINDEDFDNNNHRDGERNKPLSHENFKDDNIDTNSDSAPKDYSPPPIEVSSDGSNEPGATVENSESTNIDVGDSMLPQGYKEEEERRVEEKFGKETNDLINLYKNVQDYGAHLANPEAHFLKQAAKLTGTSFQINGHAFKKTFDQNAAVRSKIIHAFPVKLKKRKSFTKTAKGNNKTIRNDIRAVSGKKKKLKRDRKQKNRKLKKIKQNEKHNGNARERNKFPIHSISNQNFKFLPQDTVVHFYGNDRYDNYGGDNEKFHSFGGDEHGFRQHEHFKPFFPSASRHNNNDDSYSRNRDEKEPRHLDDSKREHNGDNRMEDEQRQREESPDTAENMLPQGYIDDENEKLEYKMRNEEDAISSLYKQASKNGDRNSKSEESIIDKISKLTSTSWGLEKRNFSHAQSDDSFRRNFVNKKEEYRHKENDDDSKYHDDPRTRNFVIIPGSRAAQKFPFANSQSDNNLIQARHEFASNTENSNNTNSTNHITANTSRDDNNDIEETNKNTDNRSHDDEDDNFEERNENSENNFQDTGNDDNDDKQERREGWQDYIGDDRGNDDFYEYERLEKQKIAHKNHTQDEILWLMKSYKPHEAINKDEIESNAYSDYPVNFNGNHQNLEYIPPSTPMHFKNNSYEQEEKTAEAENRNYEKSHGYKNDTDDVKDADANYDDDDDSNHFDHVVSDGREDERDKSKKEGHEKLENRQTLKQRQDKTHKNQIQQKKNIKTNVDNVEKDDIERYTNDGNDDHFSIDHIINSHIRKHAGGLEEKLPHGYVEKERKRMDKKIRKQHSNVKDLYDDVFANNGNDDDREPEEHFVDKVVGLSQTLWGLSRKNSYEKPSQSMNPPKKSSEARNLRKHNTGQSQGFKRAAVSTVNRKQGNKSRHKNTKKTSMKKKSVKEERPSKREKTSEIEWLMNNYHPGQTENLLHNDIDIENVVKSVDKDESGFIKSQLKHTKNHPELRDYDKVAEYRQLSPLQTQQGETRTPQQQDKAENMLPNGYIEDEREAMNSKFEKEGSTLQNLFELATDSKTVESKKPEDWFLEKAVKLTQSSIGLDDGMQDKEIEEIKKKTNVREGISPFVDDDFVVEDMIKQELNLNKKQRKKKRLKKIHKQLQRLHDTNPLLFESILNKSLSMDFMNVSSISTDSSTIPIMDKQLSPVFNALNKVSRRHSKHKKNDNGIAISDSNVENNDGMATTNSRYEVVLNQDLSTLQNSLPITALEPIAEDGDFSNKDSQAKTERQKNYNGNKNNTIVMTLSRAKNTTIKNNTVFNDNKKINQSIKNNSSPITRNVNQTNKNPSSVNSTAIDSVDKSLLNLDVLGKNDSSNAVPNPLFIAQGRNEGTSTPLDRSQPLPMSNDFIVPIPTFLITEKDKDDSMKPRRRSLRKIKTLDKRKNIIHKGDILKRNHKKEKYSAKVVKTKNINKRVHKHHGKNGRKKQKKRTDNAIKRGDTPNEMRIDESESLKAEAQDEILESDKEIQNTPSEEKLDLERPESNLEEMPEIPMQNDDSAAMPLNDGSNILPDSYLHAENDVLNRKLSSENMELETLYNKFVQGSPKPEEALIDQIMKLTETTWGINKRHVMREKILKLLKMFIRKRKPKSLRNKRNLENNELVSIIFRAFPKSLVEITHNGTENRTVATSGNITLTPPLNTTLIPRKNISLHLLTQPILNSSVKVIPEAQNDAVSENLIQAALRKLNITKINTLKNHTFNASKRASLNELKWLMSEFKPKQSYNVKDELAQIKALNDVSHRNLSQSHIESGESRPHEQRGGYDTKNDKPSFDMYHGHHKAHKNDDDDDDDDAKPKHHIKHSHDYYDSEKEDDNDDNDNRYTHREYGGHMSKPWKDYYDHEEEESRHHAAKHHIFKNGFPYNVEAEATENLRGRNGFRFDKKIYEAVKKDYRKKHDSTKDLSEQYENGDCDPDIDDIFSDYVDSDKVELGVKNPKRFNEINVNSKRRDLISFTPNELSVGEGDRKSSIKEATWLMRKYKPSNDQLMEESDEINALLENNDVNTTQTNNYNQYKAMDTIGIHAHLPQAARSKAKRPRNKLRCRTLRKTNFGVAPTVHPYFSSSLQQVIPVNPKNIIVKFASSADENDDEMVEKENKSNEMAMTKIENEAQRYKKKSKKNRNRYKILNTTNSKEKKAQSESSIDKQKNMKDIRNSKDQNKKNCTGKEKQKTKESVENKNDEGVPPLNIPMESTNNASEGLSNVEIHPLSDKINKKVKQTNEESFQDNKNNGTKCKNKNDKKKTSKGKKLAKSKFTSNSDLKAKKIDKNKDEEATKDIDLKTSPKCKGAVKNDSGRSNKTEKNIQSKDQEMTENKINAPKKEKGKGKDNTEKVRDEKTVKSDDKKRKEHEEKEKVEKKNKQKEKERLEKEQYAEQEKLEREQNEEQERQEAENQREEEKLEADQKNEQERVEKEGRKGQEKLEREEKEEKAKLDKEENTEEEKLDKEEQREREKLKKEEKEELERLQENQREEESWLENKKQKDKKKKGKLEKELKMKAEKEEKEKLGKERKEKLEKERKEKLEKERKEKLEKERKEKFEKERKEKLEKERKEKQRLKEQKIKVEKEKALKEKKIKDEKLKQIEESKEQLSEKFPNHKPDLNLKPKQTKHAAAESIDDIKLYPKKNKQPPPKEKKPPVKSLPPQYNQNQNNIGNLPNNGGGQPNPQPPFPNQQRIGNNNQQQQQQQHPQQTSPMPWPQSINMQNPKKGKAKGKDKRKKKKKQGKRTKRHNDDIEYFVFNTHSISTTNPIIFNKRTKIKYEPENEIPSSKRFNINEIEWLLKKPVAKSTKQIKESNPHKKEELDYTPDDPFKEDDEFGAKVSQPDQIFSEAYSGTKNKQNLHEDNSDHYERDHFGSLPPPPTPYENYDKFATEIKTDLKKKPVDYDAAPYNDRNSDDNHEMRHNTNNRAGDNERESHHAERSYNHHGDDADRATNHHGDDDDRAINHHGDDDDRATNHHGDDNDRATNHHGDDDDDTHDDDEDRYHDSRNNVKDYGDKDVRNHKKFKNHEDKYTYENLPNNNQFHLKAPTNDISVEENPPIHNIDSFMKQETEHQPPSHGNGDSHHRDNRHREGNREKEYQDEDNRDKEYHRHDDRDKEYNNHYDEPEKGYNTDDDGDKDYHEKDNRDKDYHRQDDRDKEYHHQGDRDKEYHDLDDRDKGYHNEDDRDKGYHSEDDRDKSYHNGSDGDKSYHNEDDRDKGYDNQDDRDKSYHNHDDREKGINYEHENARYHGDDKDHDEVGGHHGNEGNHYKSNHDEHDEGTKHHDNREFNEEDMNDYKDEQNKQHHKEDREHDYDNEYDKPSPHTSNIQNGNNLDHHKNVNYKEGGEHDRYEDAPEERVSSHNNNRQEKNKHESYSRPSKEHTTANHGNDNKDAAYEDNTHNHNDNSYHTNHKDDHYEADDKEQHDTGDSRTSDSHDETTPEHHEGGGHPRPGPLFLSRDGAKLKDEEEDAVPMYLQHSQEKMHAMKMIQNLHQMKNMHQYEDEDDSPHLFSDRYVMGKYHDDHIQNRHKIKNRDFTGQHNSGAHVQNVIAKNNVNKDVKYRNELLRWRNNDNHFFHGDETNYHGADITNRLVENHHGMFKGAADNMQFDGVFKTHAGDIRAEKKTQKNSANEQKKIQAYVNYVKEHSDKYTDTSEKTSSPMELTPKNNAQIRPVKSIFHGSSPIRNQKSENVYSSKINSNNAIIGDVKRRDALKQLRSHYVTDNINGNGNIYNDKNMRHRERRSMFYSNSFHKSIVPMEATLLLRRSQYPLMMTSSFEYKPKYVPDDVESSRKRSKTKPKKKKIKKIKKKKSKSKKRKSKKKKVKAAKKLSDLRTIAHKNLKPRVKQYQKHIFGLEAKEDAYKNRKEFEDFYDVAENDKEFNDKDREDNRSRSRDDDDDYDDDNDDDDDGDYNHREDKDDKDNDDDDKHRDREYKEKYEAEEKKYAHKEYGIDDDGDDDVDARDKYCDPETDENCDRREDLSVHPSGPIAGTDNSFKDNPSYDAGGNQYDPETLEKMIPKNVREMMKERVEQKMSKETKELQHLYDDIKAHQEKEPEERFVGEASHLISTKWGLNGNLGYQVHFPRVQHTDDDFHKIVINLNEGGVTDDEYQKEKGRYRGGNLDKRDAISRLINQLVSVPKANKNTTNLIKVEHTVKPTKVNATKLSVKPISVLFNNQTSKTIGISHPNTQIKNVLQNKTVHPKEQGGNKTSIQRLREHYKNITALHNNKAQMKTHLGVIKPRLGVKNNSQVLNASLSVLLSNATTTPALLKNVTPGATLFVARLKNVTQPLLQSNHSKIHQSGAGNMMSSLSNRISNRTNENHLIGSLEKQLENINTLKKLKNTLKRNLSTSERHEKNAEEERLQKLIEPYGDLSLKQDEDIESFLKLAQVIDPFIQLPNGYDNSNARDLVNEQVKKYLGYDKKDKIANVPDKNTVNIGEDTANVGEDTAGLQRRATAEEYYFVSDLNDSNDVPSRDVYFNGPFGAPFKDTNGERKDKVYHKCKNEGKIKCQNEDAVTKSRGQTRRSFYRKLDSDSDFDDTKLRDFLSKDLIMHYAPKYTQERERPQELNNVKSQDDVKKQQDSSPTENQEELKWDIDLKNGYRDITGQNVDKTMASKEIQNLPTKFDNMNGMKEKQKVKHRKKYRNSDNNKIKLYNNKKINTKLRAGENDLKTKLKLENSKITSHFKNYMKEISNEIPESLKNNLEPNIIDEIYSTMTPAFPHNKLMANDLEYNHLEHPNEYFERPTPTLADQVHSLYDELDSNNHVLSNSEHGNEVDPNGYFNEFVDLPNHGVFHGGMQDGVPVDDHPAHNLFRHLSENGNFGDALTNVDTETMNEIDTIQNQAYHPLVRYKKPSQSFHRDSDFDQSQRDTSARYQSPHPVSKNTMNYYHSKKHFKPKPKKHKKNKKISDSERKLVNPLDYHIPEFPQRMNSESLNNFFEKETERIAKHVNEFPIVSDKESIHPSVYKDYLNMLPIALNNQMLRPPETAHINVDDDTLIKSGALGHRTIIKPAVGIGLAAIAPAGVDEPKTSASSNVESPIQKFMENLAKSITQAQKLQKSLSDTPCKNSGSKEGVQCNNNPIGDLLSKFTQAQLVNTNNDNIKLQDGGKSVDNTALPQFLIPESSLPKNMLQDKCKIDPFQVLTANPARPCEDKEKEEKHLDAAIFQKLTSEGSPHPAVESVDNVATHTAKLPGDHGNENAAVTVATTPTDPQTKVVEVNHDHTKAPLKYEVELVAHHDKDDHEKQPMSIAADPLPVKPLPTPPPPQPASIAAEPLLLRPVVVAPPPQPLSLAPDPSPNVKVIEAAPPPDPVKPLPVIGLANPYEILTSDTKTPAREMNATKPKKEIESKENDSDHSSKQVETNSSESLQPTINDAITQITTLLKQPKIMNNAEALSVFADTLKQISQTVVATKPKVSETERSKQVSETKAKEKPIDNTELEQHSNTSKTNNTFVSYKSSGGDKIKLDGLEIKMDDKGDEDRVIRPISLFKKLSDQTYKAKKKSEPKYQPENTEDDDDSVQFVRFSHQKNTDPDPGFHVSNKVTDNTIPKWNLPKLLKAFTEMNGSKRAKINSIKYIKRILSLAKN